MHWIAVQTHVNGEARARLNLVRQGYEVYLPQYVKTRRHARKTERVVRPLFPGYMFVAFDQETTPWRAINSSFGVKRIVQCGDAPAQVPDEVIEAIMGREDESGLVKLVDRDALKPGQRVDIVDGPMMGCSGLFVATSDADRVYVLLDILGRNVRARVSVQALKAG